MAKKKFRAETFCRNTFMNMAFLQCGSFHDTLGKPCITIIARIWLFPYKRTKNCFYI